MKYFYSLYTGELVPSDVRADWMGETEVEPPETDVDQSAFFEVGIWVIRGAEPEIPEPTADEKARWKRDGLLRELDAIVSNPLRWAEFDDATKQALAKRRQALLDVPQQEGFPYDIDWPDNPLEEL